jgi:hypothetical protein
MSASTDVPLAAPVALPMGRRIRPIIAMPSCMVFMGSFINALRCAPLVYLRALERACCPAPPSGSFLISR